MIFSQVFVIYGRKLRFHHIKYLTPVIRLALTPVEEICPVVVVGRKLIIVVRKRYPYLNRIQQIPEIIDSLVEISESQRDVPI